MPYWSQHWWRLWAAQWGERGAERPEQAGDHDAESLQEPPAAAIPDASSERDGRPSEGSSDGALRLQRLAGNRAVAAIRSLAGGEALDERTRVALEARLGGGLRGIRVHRGPAAAGLARRLNAAALASGEQIVLGEDAPAPESAAGQELLAHEATHVLQQRRSGASPGISAADDPYERQADALARGEAPRPFPAGPPPAVQRQPLPGSRPAGPVAAPAGQSAGAGRGAAAPAERSDADLLADLSLLVQLPNDAANPPPVRAALAMLASYGISPANISFVLLADATWVGGLGLHRRAESRWNGSTAEIAVAPELLADFRSYLADPVAHLEDGFAVLRTLGHELRHLQRNAPGGPSPGRVNPGERAFQREVRSAAARLHISPQTYADVYSGQMLYSQTAYPIEEMLARIEEVGYVKLEWQAATRMGPLGDDAREHFEMQLQEIAAYINLQINIYRGACESGAAGLNLQDFERGIANVEAEISRRYGTSSGQLRLWQLARAGVAFREAGSTYHPLIRLLGRIFP